MFGECHTAPDRKRVEEEGKDGRSVGRSVRSYGKGGEARR